MTFPILAGCATIMASNPGLKMKPQDGRNHNRRAVPDWARRFGRRAGLIGIGRYRIPSTNGGDGFVVKDSTVIAPDSANVNYVYGLEQAFIGHDSTSDLPKFATLRPMNRIWGWRILSSDGLTVLMNWQWQTPHASAGYTWEPTGYSGAGTFKIEVAWQTEVLMFPTTFQRFRYPFTDTRDGQEQLVLDTPLGQEPPQAEEPAPEAPAKKKKH
jgi:hypothetical protein